VRLTGRVIEHPQCHAVDRTPGYERLAAVVDRFEYATHPGRLVSLPIDDRPRKGVEAIMVDVDIEVDTEVVGPEAVFATMLAEVAVVAKDLKAARSAMADVFRDRPVIAPVVVTPGSLA
jgi:hypothetical protein